MRRKEPIDVLRPLKIRVLICRLGQMDQTKFDLYANIVKKSNRINLAELTPLLSTAPLSVFLRQIGSSGSIHFDFVDAEDVNETVDSEDFQLYHRVFAAIGIGYHENCRSDHDQFEQIHQSVKHCSVTRHFAFEPGENAEDNHKDIVVIPNQDLDQVQFYLQTMLNDFAISLLRRFDQLSQEIGSQAEFPSPRDFDATLSREAQNKIHLRFAGRRFKLMGDLYLLAGAYNEAVVSYVGASEETKSAGDHLWHAGAQEGLQISLCLQQYNSLESADLSTRREIWWGLPGRLKEVAVLYDKTVMPRYSFAIQSQVAELCWTLGDMGEAASALSLGWNSCRPLVVQEKLAVLAGLITKFQSFGMHRKANFYRKRLVFHLSNLEQHSMASTLILPAVNTPWLELRRSLLSQAMDLAEAAHEHSRFANLALQLLSNAAHVLTTTEQEALKSKIKSHSKRLVPSKAFPHRMDCFETTVAVDQRQLSRVETFEMTRKASPLVYMPMSRGRPERQDETPIGMVGEPIQVRILLSNPFAFRLDVKKLCIASVNVDCDPIDLVLEPLERGRSSTLYVTAKTKGDLWLNEASMLLFKIHQIELPFDPVKLLIHDAQPLLRLVSSLKHIELIDGQMQDIAVEVQNVNQTDVTHLSLSGPDCVCFGDVPTCILAQDSAIIHMKLRGKLVYGPKISVSIDYSHRNPDSSTYLVRTLKIEIPITVRPGLAITSCKFFPLTAHRASLCSKLSSFNNLANDSEARVHLDGFEWCHAIVDVANESSLSFRCRIQDGDTCFRVGQLAICRVAVPFKRVPKAADVAVRLLWETCDGRRGETRGDDIDFNRLDRWVVEQAPFQVSLWVRREEEEKWSIVEDMISCPMDTFMELKYKVSSNNVTEQSQIFTVRPSVPGIAHWNDFVLIDGCLEASFSEQADLVFKVMALNQTFLHLDLVYENKDLGVTSYGLQTVINFVDS